MSEKNTRILIAASTLIKSQKNEIRKNSLLPLNVASFLFYHYVQFIKHLFANLLQSFGAQKA